MALITIKGITIEIDGETTKLSKALESVKGSSKKLQGELLNVKQPKKVVVILFDGMGSLIIDEILKNDDFFIKNKICNITSVFPSTTTAATTSFFNWIKSKWTWMVRMEYVYKASW